MYENEQWETVFSTLYDAAEHAFEDTTLDRHLQANVRERLQECKYNFMEDDFDYYILELHQLIRDREEEKAKFLYRQGCRDCLALLKGMAEE